MRSVVMAMMTTLNGRLDDPDAWMTGIPDDLYAELDRVYETFDTFWSAGRPTRRCSNTGRGPRQPSTARTISRSMARKMNAYRKYVFTGASEGPALEWNNAEPALAQGDADIIAFVEEPENAARRRHRSGGRSPAGADVRPARPGGRVPPRRATGCV